MPYKILPDIISHQEKILENVFKFRFINRIQLQKILGHKDPRRINAWLKDLVEKNYLGRIYSHKLLENTKPAIYYLSNNGILWCKDNVGLAYGNNGDSLESADMKKFYEDKHASKTFINHCISICEMYLQIKAQEKENKSEYDFFTKTDWWMMHKNRKDYVDRKQYVPDVQIEKITNPMDESISSITFRIELFDPHVPKYALEYKVRQYLKYHEEEKGMWKYEIGLDGKFPRILFVFMNGQKLSRLKTYKKVTEHGLSDPSIWKTVRETS